MRSERSCALRNALAWQTDYFKPIELTRLQQTIKKKKNRQTSKQKRHRFPL